MKKALYLLIITLLLLFSVSAGAQETESEYYTVVKGDTLWDISGSKLQDSFLWPKLWKVNPQIENPDLIYPGDRIRIPSKEELMRMLSSDEEVRVLTAPLEAPIIEMPEEKPKKYIVNRDLYIASGWIEKKYSPTGKIISSPGDRTILGEGDLVYLESDGGAIVGDKFYVIRKVKKVMHPKKWWKSLGYQIRVAGILEVVGMDGENLDVPKAMIITSFEEFILVGDGLIRYTEIESPVVPEFPRNPDIEGYIVESYMNNTLVGEREIVYVDKGQEDGIEVGDTFSALYLAPEERIIGTIQIFAVRQKTASAVILQHEQEITIGGTWGQK